MSFTIRAAQRGNVQLVAGIAGPSGGGKTFSALLLARGLAGANGRIVLLDTEHGRSQMYSDIGAPWDWIEFDPPFTPERYVEAIKAAQASKPAVIVIDSISHEYEGEGGLFDIVEAFLQKRAGDDQRKRAALSFAAWNEAKQRHKRLLLHILRLDCHLITCMRAQDKIELVKEGGQLKAVPKRSLTGLDGWESICERRLPYEMTCSFLVLPDRPGVPRPLKPMPPSMAQLIPLDRQLSQGTGQALAKWAAADPQGAPAASAEPVREAPTGAELAGLADELLELAPHARAAIDESARGLASGEYRAWLEGQIARMRAAKGVAA